MKMIYLLILTAFYLFNLTFHPMAFGAQDQVVLLEVQNRYNNTNDFEANFIQEYIGKIMKKPQRGEGKVYFKKKGMMRWDYRIPNQKLISNGLTLWYFQPDEKQVLVSDISKLLKEKTPLAFLAGEGDISRDFNLLNVSEAISPKGENFILELTPKEPHTAMAKLILTVDQKTYSVIQTDVIDGIGNITRTRFTDIKTNVDLPTSLFHFTIPPGTEVLKVQEPPASSSGGKRSPSK